MTRTVSNESSIAEGILSPIGKYEYNPITSVSEEQLKEQLKQKGFSNQSIAGKIRWMKIRGELPF